MLLSSTPEFWLSLMKDSTNPAGIYFLKNNITGKTVIFTVLAGKLFITLHKTIFFSKVPSLTEDIKLYGLEAFLVELFKPYPTTMLILDTNYQDMLKEVISLRLSLGTSLYKE